MLLAAAAPNSFISLDRFGDVIQLATANILVGNRSGVLLSCRALIDSDSQVHLLLVTTRLANQLQVWKFQKTGLS